MPSLDHETIVDLFRARPRLAPELLGEALGLDLPAHRDVAVAESDFTQITPVPYRADLALLLKSRARNVHGLIVEAQLARDDEKLYSWPYYASAGRARWRCPTTVVVVTPYARVARWAERRRETGHGNTYAPIVVGPDRIPEVVDVEAAIARPELAVLSAMAHGRGASGARIAYAAIAAVDRLDPASGALYYDVVLASLDRAARTALEALMQNGHREYKSDFARKYFGEGVEKGIEQGIERGIERGIEQGIERGRELARGMLLNQLRLKFREVPAGVVERVEAAGFDELGRWSERVLFAAALDDVFAE
jgi:hypothetical protein